MPIVDTSVAVATPSTTAARMMNGSAIAGAAITKPQAIDFAAGRLTALVSSPRARHHTTTPSASPITMAGTTPPANSAAIETLAVAPTVMSTRLGGIVSDI